MKLRALIIIAFIFLLVYQIVALTYRLCEQDIEIQTLNERITTIEKRFTGFSWDRKLLEKKRI